MGTAHVLVHQDLLNRIMDEFKDSIRVLEMMDYGEANIYSIVIETNLLPDGYNGAQEMFIRDGQLGFRRDTDT